MPIRFAKADTDSAKKLAEDKIKFMDEFLHQFYSEWNIGRNKR